MERTIGEVKIEVTQGDITAQRDMDAIVNAANAELKSGGGVAGAIHGAAGPGLYEEARPLAPVGPGEAVVTGGHNLPNRYVIHTLGPIYGSDKPESELLANCYRNSLARAEERGMSSLAFPAISTGIFGYPIEEAAEVTLRTVLESAEELQSVRLVRFVLFGEEDRRSTRGCSSGSVEIANRVFDSLFATPDSLLFIRLEVDEARCRGSLDFLGHGGACAVVVGDGAPARHTRESPDREVVTRILFDSHQKDGPPKGPVSLSRLALPREN